MRQLIFTKKIIRKLSITVLLICVILANTGCFTLSDPIVIKEQTKLAQAELEAFYGREFNIREAGLSSSTYSNDIIFEAIATPVGREEWTFEIYKNITKDGALGYSTHLENWKGYTLVDLELLREKYFPATLPNISMNWDFDSDYWRKMQDELPDYETAIKENGGKMKSSIQLGYIYEFDSPMEEPGKLFYFIQDVNRLNLNLEELEFEIDIKQLGHSYKILFTKEDIDSFLTEEDLKMCVKRQVDADEFLFKYFSQNEDTYTISTYYEPSLIQKERSIDIYIDTNISKEGIRSNAEGLFQLIDEAKKKDIIISGIRYKLLLTEDHSIKTLFFTYEDIEKFEKVEDVLIKMEDQINR